MTTKLIKFSLCLLAVICNCNYYAFSQTNPILDNFSIYQNGEKVYLNWVIKSGSTCNGIQIFRSSNNSSFIEIGNIAGVCGNISFATPYSFIDENPAKNTVNSYRLELGNNGTSQTLSIEIIDIGKEGSQVRPNPIYENAKIYFDNNTKELHYLLIYDAKGNFFSKVSTKEDYFQYNSTSISNGTYFFKILNNEQILTTQGKFVVMH